LSIVYDFADLLMVCLGSLGRNSLRWQRKKFNAIEKWPTYANWYAEGGPMAYQRPFLPLAGAIVAPA